MRSHVTNRSATARQDHLTFRGNVKQGRHGWLRLTPAYSLHVVTEILEEATRDDFVLDPFSGTGTTPLASAVHVTRCHALDINPFLVWLGNVKCARYCENQPRKLTEYGERIVRKLRAEKHAAREWVPDLKNIEKWWDAPVLQTLSRLCKGISAVEDGSMADLLKVCFLRVMIASAHVSFSHQSMSFRQRRAEPTLFHQASPSEEILEIFLDQIGRVGRTLLTDQPAAEAQVFLGDSRSASEYLPRKGYTLLITSPPYANRMSYIRELRPYMYWLRYLTNGRQAGELDWQAIGGTWGCATSLLASWQPDPSVAIPHPQFAKLVREIKDRHYALGQYVHKYFEDIVRHVESVKDVLAPGATCHYIVGNSKFYDTVLPVEEIYASIFEAAGYRNVAVDTLRKRTSKKELYEYRVYAEAP
jgi:hypothetical protein